MNQLAYSSIAAFLTHYRVLNQAAESRGGDDPLSADERAVLAAMRSLVEELPADERPLLTAPTEAVGPAEECRRRRRAEAKLRRVLLARAVLH